jgi:hypothetical protein
MGVELASSPPALTFACELDPARLTALFADPAVTEHLLALRARVALMLSDFSDERAAVVRLLNGAGVLVVGIPLLPLEHGYYFTADNAAEAAARYQEWQAWTRRHDLTWDGVGLDIEPDARVYQQMMNNPWACRLTCSFAPGFEAAFSSGGFPHVVAGCGAAVL